MEQPEVVVLCGSTKFMNEFISEQKRLTLEGRIVISVGMFGHHDDEVDIGTADDPTEVKRMLDELHKRKIDLADRVHVINPGGYIGSSTRGEIEYAYNLGVRTTYMVEP